MAPTIKKSPIGPEPTRLRQIALVAHDLEKARHLLTKILGTEVIYEDPLVAQWGLHNFLVPLGGDILEVVSPLSSSQSTLTPASRHLSKRGEGGYMIIMQSASAITRREYLKSHNLAKVIFEHRTEESVCIQYHPKGIKGGVIPELDSHFSKEGGGRVPNGMKERFAPWHACGPPSGFEKYGSAMKRHSQLHLMAVTLRLAPGDTDVEGAVRQWEGLFGVGKLEKEGSREVAFTNAIMDFCEGRDGEEEGLRDVVIGVEGNEKFQGI